MKTKLFILLLIMFPMISLGGDVSDRMDIMLREISISANIPIVNGREKGGESFILHIEIQNNNDPVMPWRMLRYLTDIGFRYRNESIRQHLIYIGEDPITMPNGLQRHGLAYDRNSLGQPGPED